MGTSEQRLSKLREERDKLKENYKKLLQKNKKLNNKFKKKKEEEKRETDRVTDEAIKCNDNVLYEDEILGVVGDINTIIVKTTETNKTESNKQELTEDQLQLLVDLVAYFNEWDHPIDFDREYLIEELYNILKRKSL